MQPAIRNRYNYDRRENSENNALYIDSTKEEENLTKQEFAEEVDINTILRRFNITGQLPENVRMPTYTRTSVKSTTSTQQQKRHRTSKRSIRANARGCALSLRQRSRAHSSHSAITRLTPKKQPNWG